VSTAKKLWRNDYFKTAVAIAVIVAIVLGFFFGLQLVLNTPYPALTVESGSMCIQYDGLCDGWSHPFERTLHVGDIIIVQGVDPKTLNTNYPNSDIIVYRDIVTHKLIVHRIAAVQDINGTLYFETKGDGNSPVHWPGSSAYYDNIPDSRGVPQDLVVGKVIMRVPWVGQITLFMRTNTWGLPVVIGLILLLVVVEFVIPILREKQPKQTQQQQQPPAPLEQSPEPQPAGTQPPEPQPPKQQPEQQSDVNSQS
jgi:signal peptidase I